MAMKGNTYILLPLLKVAIISLFLPNLIEQNSSGYSQGENGVKNAFSVAVDKSDHRKWPFL